MIPCSLDDSYGLMNIHWQHFQRGSLFLRCIHIDLFTCPSPCADAPERTTNPLLSLVDRTNIDVLETLTLWLPWNKVRMSKGIVPATQKHAFATLTTRSLWHAGVPKYCACQQKKLHEGRRSAGKCKKTSSKRCACHEILTSRSVLTPPRSASILSEMPCLSRFGMVRVRFRPPVL